MVYRQLGKAGAKLSVIGLGSYLTIGFRLEAGVARDTIRRAYELGMNFFDTANAYNEGQAEETLGRCLADFPRASLFVATKVFAPMGEGPNDRGLSAKHIYEQCHASLRRLRMDYVDLYQCHRPDLSTPLEETVRTMDDLARQGKILYWGTSEWPAWMIAEANSIARQIGAREAVSNQPRYNLLYRVPEMELFQYCRHANIGNVVFSPIAHGVLTGKYAPGHPPPAGTRAADPQQNMVIMNMYWKEEYLQKALAFKSIAQEIGLTGSQLALAWILRRKEVASAIIGASKVGQVEENAKAAEVVIPPDVLVKLDTLFPGPKESYPC
jgi:aryl-alcohol dehydrogenase-like predicted oxidoreductase